MVGSEERLGSLHGELLEFVRYPAARVVAPARVAFGRFVVEGRSQGVQDRGGRRALGGNQIERAFLAVAFLLNQGSHGGVFRVDERHFILAWVEEAIRKRQARVVDRYNMV
jgi:hypothetical protein